MEYKFYSFPSKNKKINFILCIATYNNLKRSNDMLSVITTWRFNVQISL